MLQIKENRPSEQMRWMDIYGGKEIRGKALEPVENLSMWQFLERRLRNHGDKYPAFSYFGRKTKRSELISNVVKWARAFKAIGLKADDKVVIFAPFTPEVASMLLALNYIGAWPILPNLSSCIDALKAASEEAAVFIVADAVEKMISPVLNEPRGRKIILTSIFSDMPAPVRMLVLFMKDGLLFRRLLRQNPGYVAADRVLKKFNSFEGPLAPEYDENRPAIITSSGGTSENGFAKQIMITNRAMLAMMSQSEVSPFRFKYVPGAVCLDSFPPFISTAIFVMFFAPLATNMTCIMDPREPGVAFIEDVLKFRPQVASITGGMWLRFFSYVCEQEKKGKKVDLSFLTMPIMGGDGVSAKDLKWMDDTLRRCGAKQGILSGYGMSEAISFIAADFRDIFASDVDTSTDIISVGYPTPASTVGVFDKNGKELQYGQEGEIWVKTTTLMKAYYRNDELTGKVLKDGWFHSGDLGFLDEEGKLYVLCRISEHLNISGNTVYPVDIEREINCDPQVRNCLVVNVADVESTPKLVAHLVLTDDCSDTSALLCRLDSHLGSILPEGVRIEGYKANREFLKLNNVCKVDRNYYRRDRKGYLKPDGGILKEVLFE